jgi:hypothetical protein
MGHYHIGITVDREDVETIKREFRDYISDVGEMTLMIKTDNDVMPSAELTAVIEKMFFKLLMTIDFGRFEGVN